MYKHEIPYSIQLAGLTGRIYAGRVNAKGNAFTSKTDCTQQALEAVAWYVVEQGGEATVEIPQHDPDNPGQVVIRKLKIRSEVVARSSGGHECLQCGAPADRPCEHECIARDD